MSYGPLSVVYDLFSSIYSFFTSLCCAVNCTTEGAKVNDHNCKVVKLLAEGGFSFVYLVEDSSKKQYALKKVLSTLGGALRRLRPAASLVSAALAARGSGRRRWVKWRRWLLLVQSRAGGALSLGT